MYYLIAIPIAALLYHSIWILGKEYLGKEPLWLKIYMLLSLIYIVVIPAASVNYLLDKLGFSETISAIVMGLTVFVIFFLAITHYPKRTIKKDGYSEYQ